MPSGDAALDVVVDAHAVQRPARRGVRVERRWKAGCLRVSGDDAGHGSEIPIGLAFRVVPPGEIVDVVGPRWLGAEQVVQTQIEASGQLPDGRVARVDQFPAPLGDLVRVPVGVVRKHPSAHAAGCLVHRAPDPGVSKLQRAIQSGDAAADDHDRRRMCGQRESRSGHRRGCCAGGGQKRPPRDAAPPGQFGLDGPGLAPRLDRYAMRLRGLGIAEQRTKSTEQRSFGWHDGAIVAELSGDASR